MESCERETDAVLVRATGAALLVASVFGGGSPVGAQPAPVAIEPTPAFEVGRDLGSTEFFGGIGDALRLPDGRFVVADPQAREIWFISEAGDVLARAGREGEGPGEFDRLGAGMFARSDGTIAIWDSGLGKMTLLDQRAGGVVETFRPERPPPGTVQGTPQALIGGTPGGDFVLGWLTFGSREIDGLTADQFHFVHFDAQGNFVRVLGEDSGFLRVLSGPSQYRGPHPFTPEGRWDSGGGQVLFTNGLLPEFSRFDPASGRMLRVTVDPAPSPPTPREAWAAIVPTLRSSDSGFAAAALELDQTSGHVPVFAEILAGPDSTVWLKRYDPRTDALRGASGFGGGTWDVWSADGRQIGTFVAPARFLPLGVDETWVWGVATDKLGTPCFAAYRRLN